MIQRIQTLWLLLAALVNAGLFYFDLYRSDLKVIRVGDHYPSLLLTIVITALPLLAIFMYKNRTKQRNMVLISMLGTISFVSMILMRVTNLNDGSSAPVTGSYWIGSVLPIIALVFLIMAIRGIRKDEKLVKSLDRLR